MNPSRLPALPSSRRSIDVERRVRLLDTEGRRRIASLSYTPVP